MEKVFKCYISASRLVCLVVDLVVFHLTNSSMFNFAIRCLIQYMIHIHIPWCIYNVSQLFFIVISKEPRLNAISSDGFYYLLLYRSNLSSIDSCDLRNISQLTFIILIIWFISKWAIYTYMSVSKMHSKIFGIVSSAYGNLLLLRINGGHM